MISIHTVVIQAWVLYSMGDVNTWLFHLKRYESNLRI